MPIRRHAAAGALVGSSPRARDRTLKTKKVKVEMMRVVRKACSRLFDSNQNTVLDNWMNFARGLCRKGNLADKKREYTWEDSDQPGLCML